MGLVGQLAKGPTFKGVGAFGSRPSVVDIALLDSWLPHV